MSDLIVNWGKELLSHSPLLAEVLCGRPPAEGREPASLLGRRSGGELQGVRALARPGYFNLIDLRFFFPARGFDEPFAREAAARAAKSILGQETLARWIGDIEIQTLPAFESCAERLIGVHELPAAVTRLIEDASSAMPSRPWHELDPGADWSIIEGEPEEAEDYPDQCDLVAGITALPWMWRNALSSIAFDSARFSRFGERFSYLKLDGASGWDYARFTDREEIEQALDAPLRAGGLGSVVGGGTGLRYSYIELALTDVEEAWQEIAAMLSEGRVPKRTWLLFHDAEHSAKWFGLYDDTPPPPRRCFFRQAAADGARNERWRLKRA